MSNSDAAFVVISRVECYFGVIFAKRRCVQAFAFVFEHSSHQVGKLHQLYALGCFLSGVGRTIRHGGHGADRGAVSEIEHSIA